VNNLGHAKLITVIKLLQELTYQPLLTLWLAYYKKAKTGVETLEKLITPHYPSDCSDHDHMM
jgi:hypothetical protein